MGGFLNFGGLGNWSSMAALGKRKAVKSPSPSSSSGSSSGEELEEEEAVVNGHEGGSGSEELDSDVSGSEEEEEDGGGELNTSSDSDHSSQPSQEIVNINFDFFDPKPNDFHGIKALLRTYLDDEVWDISGFVDLVLAQTTVGTVIKAGDEGNPIALLTALNLGRYQKSSSMLELHKFLRVKSAHKPESGLLEDLWGKEVNEVALLVSERLVNVPIELAPPLYKGLFEEVMWATEDEPTQELRDSFKLKKYLYLTRVFQELVKEGDNTELKKKAELQNNGELIYIKPEDEILHQLSLWSFSFPVTGESAAARQSKGLRELRIVMAVEAKHIEKFQTQLKELAE